MVSFRPPFKLMLVSLNLVLLLSLLAAPALADGNHADNAVRRHAARAGRLSKRFPPVPEMAANAPSVNRRARHHRHDNHYYGLTPEEIDELLKEEQIEDDGFDEPVDNSSNSTSLRSHRLSSSRTSSDSQDAASTSSSSFHAFSLPTANSTSTSHSTHSTSSASPSATSSDDSTPTSTSHTHSQSSSPTDSASSTDSSSSHSSASHASSADNVPNRPSASSTSSASHTSASSDGNAVNSLLSGLLGPTSTSSSSASQQTGGSDSDNDSDNGSPSASSSSRTPTATHASHSSSSSNSSDDQDSNTTFTPSTSKQSQTSQPDFYSFTPQTTRSSSRTSATPTSTASGLIQSLVNISLGSSSSTAKPSATPSPSDSGSDDNSSTASKQHSSSQSSHPTDGSDEPSPTSTSSSKTSSPTSTADGSDSGNTGSTAPFASQTSSSTASAPTTTADSSSNGSNGTTASQATSANGSASTTDDGTGSSTATSGSPQTATITTGPTPTSITGFIPTSTVSIGTNTGGGSGSESSSASSSAPSHSSSSSSSSSSESSDSSDKGSSTSSSATTNPYWYANTKSLNMAPSSTSSADQPAQTGSQSSSSNDGSSGSTTSSSSSGINNAPAAQDLPTTIVPSADSYDQPPDTTAIGLLFKQDMQWTWVISQADLTAQIFAFMPDLVSQSAGLESSKVSTVKLSSYSVDASDTASARSLSTARTLYIAYVPTSSVEEIQAMVSNTSSPFYTAAAEGAPQQLASQVDPTFNILSVAGKVAAGSKQSAKSTSAGSGDDGKLRNGLIGVGCGLAGVFAVVAGVLVWRKKKGEGEGEGKEGGVSRAHTIRSFHGGLRETWAPDVMDQHRALDTTGTAGPGEMQQVWSHDAQVYGSDGFGGYAPAAAVADPFNDAAAGAYVNMNRSSRMTERSAYSDLSQMTEAQRIQYDYESSRRSFGSEHSGSNNSASGSAEMASTYQEDYRVPRQHTSNHAFGQRSNSTTRTRRRGSVASSTIGRPEMMSNSVLL